MRVVIVPTAGDAAATVARLVAQALRHTPDLTLGLPTGRTMIPVYERLVAWHRRGRVTFRRVTTFNLDEFVGIPGTHPGSFRAFMRRHLFSHVDLPVRAAHFPASGRGGEGVYERAIERAGGLDLCLVGIGTNGHLGFNEPGAALSAWTHRVRLEPASRRANAYLFQGRHELVPREAMSMGIATILNARAVVLLATGREKADIVRAAVVGDVTTRVPASLLQAHPNALVVLDRPSAGRLGSRVRPRRGRR